MPKPPVLYCCRAANPTFVSAAQFTRLVRRTIKHQGGELRVGKPYARARTMANGGIAPVAPDMHGSNTAIFYWACRCGLCREGMTRINRARREDRHRRTRENGGIAPISPDRHGDPYIHNNWGCICEPCVTADKLRQQGKRAARVHKGEST